jgi:hypothetical protein
MIGEKEIRGYQLKTKEYVCPICVTGQEQQDTATKVVAEDEIHDDNPTTCVRCKKVIK